MQAIKSFDYAPNSHKAKDWQKAVTRNLAVLDAVCREHDIKYALCFGGLLGAVRHRGFIPWDNDVDVVMFEPDYLKLQRLALEGKLPEGYTLVDRATEEDYPLLFGRFVDTRTSCPLSTSAFNGGTNGLFVDVFVLYPLADDPREREAEITDFLVWEELGCWVKRRSANRTPAFAKRWEEIKSIERRLGRSEALAAIEKSFRRHMPERGEWCFHSSGGAYNGFPAFKTDWFRETTYLPFEDIELAAPIGYRELLQQFYGGGWRTFPQGEKFTPYAASSINIPGPVIAHDYMQFIDEAEAVKTFRDLKDLEMEETLIRCAVNPALYGGEAELGARDLNREYKELIPDAKGAIEPAHIASPTAGADFVKFASLARDVIALQTRGHFKTCRIAAPIDSSLLSAALWSHYLNESDFWTVERIISLQKGDTAQGTFGASATDDRLETALEATDNLYQAIDRANAQTAKKCAVTLNEICPSGRHTAVAWSFVALQTALDKPRDESETHTAFTTVKDFLGRFPDEDYLKLFHAQLLALTGAPDAAETEFADLAQHSMNGMVLQSAFDICHENGIPFKMRKLGGDAKPSAEAPSPYAASRNLSMKECLAHGFAGLGAARRVFSSGVMTENKKLQALNEQMKPLRDRVARYRDLRRLTDRRFNAWELVYPRKQALLKSAAAGRMNEVRRYAKPYLDAVYRLFDKEHLGVFIDEDVFEACKPLFVKDRGEQFPAAYEALVFPEHRGNISDLLRKAGVDHPYLR